MWLKWEVFETLTGKTARWFILSAWCVFRTNRNTKYKSVQKVNFVIQIPLNCNQMCETVCKVEVLNTQVDFCLQVTAVIVWLCKGTAVSNGQTLFLFLLEVAQHPVTSLSFNFTFSLWNLGQNYNRSKFCLHEAESQTRNWPIGKSPERCQTKHEVRLVSFPLFGEIFPPSSSTCNIFISSFMATNCFAGHSFSFTTRGCLIHRCLNVAEWR